MSVPFRILVQSRALLINRNTDQGQSVLKQADTLMGKLTVIIIGIASYILFSWIFRSIAYSFVDDQTNLNIIAWLEYIIPAAVTFILYAIIQNIDQEYDQEDLNPIMALLVLVCLAGGNLPYSIGFGVLFNLIMVGLIIQGTLSNKNL